MTKTRTANKSQLQHMPRCLARYVGKHSGKEQYELHKKQAGNKRSLFHEATSFPTCLGEKRVRFRIGYKEIGEDRSVRREKGDRRGKTEGIKIEQKTTLCR